MDNNGIYNNPVAGLNAYRLMEELSELPGHGGWVELHKILGHPRADEQQYPPVYNVYCFRRSGPDVVCPECGAPPGQRCVEVEYITIFGHEDAPTADDLYERYPDWGWPEAGAYDD